MGFHMAQNLLAKLPEGASLTVCEIVPATLERFIQATGGKVSVGKTPKEISEKCVSASHIFKANLLIMTMQDIIITMLPVGKHVEEVFTNPETGLLAAKAQGRERLFIESSTIDVPTSLEVEALVTDSGLGLFVDAPVSGGPTGAQAATLTFMVGGDKAVVNRVKPIVMTMGKTFFHCGGHGAGLTTKQINNYLSGICMLGTAEAMNMGIKCGLDPKTLAGVINASTGRSYNSIDQNPVKGISPNSSAERDFEGGFAIELCAGVLDMAIILGKKKGASLPLSAGLLETYQAACRDKRCEGKDCRSVYKYVANIE